MTKTQFVTAVRSINPEQFDKLQAEGRSLREVCRDMAAEFEATNQPEDRVYRTLTYQLECHATNGEFDFVDN